MSQSDSEFIEQEERLRRALLHHTLLELHVSLAMIQKYIALPEECADFANLFEEAAAVLRKQQQQSKV